MRLLYANLLAEDELARLARVGRPRTPSLETIRTVARLAPRLRVFLSEGDRLWMPGDPGPAPSSTTEVLAWCETPTTAALRHVPRRPYLIVTPLWERVWTLPVPRPEVVAAVHHRGLHLRVARELGCALPGARMVESLDELERLRHDGPWVVKAPYSASGRSRYIHWEGSTLADPKARRTVERLFELHGPLLFEPWMERTADFGCSAFLTPSGLEVLGFHGQTVDRKGQFAGVDLDAEIPERAQMETVVERVAAELARAGYGGPFGIDFWTHRRPDGGLALNPLGEINARMTFGLVERAIRERQAAEGWAARDSG